MVPQRTPCINQPSLSAFFLSNYDANIATLNKETPLVTDMSNIMLFFIKEGKYKGTMQTTKLKEGDAYREVAMVC